MKTKRVWQFGLAFYGMTLSIGAAAQTTVTNNNTGATNEFPYYTGTHALSSTSAIYQSGSNVGIGTTGPASLFSVGSNSQFQVNGVGQVLAGVWNAGTVTMYVSNTNTYAGLSLYGVANSYFMDVNNNGIWDPSGSAWNGLAIGTGTNYPVRFATNSLTRMTILAGGNVGIGTTSPGAALEVKGSVKLTAGSGGAITFQDGTIQSSAYTGVTCGGDYAESVDVTGKRTSYEAGDVLVIDPDAPGKFLKATQAYSALVAGIYSTRPGTLGRRQTTPKSPDEVPLAMMGIVPTKVSAENGPIKIGDLLVASSTPGRAMRGTDRSLLTGAVIGKALGSLASGTGVVEVLVTLQ